MREPLIITTNASINIRNCNFTTPALPRRYWAFAHPGCSPLSISAARSLRITSSPNTSSIRSTAGVTRSAISGAITPVMKSICSLNEADRYMPWIASRARPQIPIPSTICLGFKSMRGSPGTTAFWCTAAIPPDSGDRRMLQAGGIWKRCTSRSFNRRHQPHRTMRSPRREGARYRLSLVRAITGRTTKKLLNNGQ